MSLISEIKNTDGMSYLKTIKNGSIDLVLTDPPYITSRKSGMDTQAKIVKNYDETKKNLKTEEDWKSFKTKEEWSEWMDKNHIPLDKRTIKLGILKSNYLKYGSIYFRHFY